MTINPLSAELNPICYLLALLGAHHILHVSRVRFKLVCRRINWNNLICLTLRLLISYIYGAPSKARNANVVYIWTYVWQR